MARRKHKHTVEEEEDDVDLNPLIDVIVLIMAFFIMGGKLTQDIRTEQITVPPTKTAAKIDVENGWDLLVINVYGSTQTGAGTPEAKIKIGTKEYKNSGIDDYTAYIAMRRVLDQTYLRAQTYADPKGTGLMLPKVKVEIRADADTQYRVVQEVQQVLCDSIDPSNKMLPVQKAMKDMKPFVNIDFTTRLPVKE